MAILATYVEPRIPERGVADTRQDMRRTYWLLEIVCFMVTSGMSETQRGVIEMPILLVLQGR